MSNDWVKDCSHEELQALVSTLKLMLLKQDAAVAKLTAENSFLKERLLEAQQPKAPPTGKEIRPCQVCGNLTPMSTDQKYCSGKCGTRAQYVARKQRAKVAGGFR